MASEIKTLEEARNYFMYAGISVRAWAKQNGIKPASVYEVLRGNRKCLRGDAHKAAVLLGLKEGVIIANEG